MNKTLVNVLMFTAGAAIGSAVTWAVVKTKYKRIADEEIASVREEYVDIMTNMKNKLKENAIHDESQNIVEMNIYHDNKEEIEDKITDVERREYYKITSMYRSDEDESDEEGDEMDQDEDEVPYINGPYVISPEDFSCSPPGYNAQALTYFTDGILADDWGVILDLDETIGEDAINHFGEYTDDIVYIRNERTEIDYEVTRDPRTYVDMLRTNPNPNYGNYEN